MNFQPAFFEISAQLIPVLFLAMVVEDKLQPEDDEGAKDRVFRTWVLVLLFWAEAASLAVVAGTIHASRVEGFVSICMLSAGLLIVLPVVGRAITSGPSHAERLGHASAGLGFLAGAVLLAAVVGF
jgi:hypothetical protein